MKYAALVFVLCFAAGCEVSGGRALYSQCDAVDSCAYPADYCIDVGGAGQCTLTCFDSFDCPSRRGFAGECLASPLGDLLCYQTCFNDFDCGSQMACSTGVCVPFVATSVPALPNYEVCGDPSECDLAFSESCYATDETLRAMCTSACDFDTDCLGRGAVRGVCRSLPAFPDRSGICFLACDGTTACPEFTACNGDVCVPNF